MLRTLVPSSTRALRSARCSAASFSTGARLLAADPRAIYDKMSSSTHTGDVYVRSLSSRAPPRGAALDDDDDVDDADPPTRKQSEIITDHNNVKDLYQRYKQATNKDEKATLVNTSALAPSVSPRRRSLTLILVRALQVIHELAVHSEAEEVRAPLVSPPASCRAASLTLRAPARRQVSVYNDLEKRGLASESKLLRDEHEELEKQLYSVDWTKVDSADFAPSARASSPPLSLGWCID